MVIEMEDQVKMEEQVKRIFVGGLPSSTTDSEIRDRFGKFADISDINLAKKDSVNGKLDHCFAHFNFHGDDQQLKKLISTFNNTRWQGKTLKIEKAKEDFLDRLSKEKVPEPQNAQNIIRHSRRDRLLENLKKAGVTDFTMKKAVPGTGIAGEKNWVVGKYGRVLPVVYMRSKDRKKVVKFDPSKYIHHLKQIKDVRENVMDHSGVTTQGWREGKMSSQNRKKQFPWERETDRSVHSDRIRDAGFKGQWNDKAETQNGHRFDIEQNETNADRRFEEGGSVSEKRASAKKKYFSDGSSSEDSSAIEGSLKRKAEYDQRAADADKISGSEVTKAKRRQICGDNNEAVKGHIDMTGTKGSKSVKTTKVRTGDSNSYQFNFFDNHDSSSLEAQEEDVTHELISKVVNTSEPSLTEECDSRKHSDLKKNSETEKSILKVEKAVNEGDSQYNDRDHEEITEKTSRKDLHVSFKLDDDKHREDELDGKDSSSEQLSDYDIGKVDEGVEGNSDDGISSIIQEMKSKGISQNRDVNLGIVGNVEESEETTLIGLERDPILEATKSKVNSKTSLPQLENLHTPESSPLKETFGIKGSEFEVKEKEIVRENSDSIGEKDAGTSFVRNLISLSNQRQSDVDSSSSDDEDEKPEDGKRDEDEVREDAVAEETGEESDSMCDENVEEEIDSSEKLAENLRNTKEGKEYKEQELEKFKVKETHEKTKNKESEFGKLGSSLSVQNRNSSEGFEPLVLDRAVLREQGFLPEDDPEDAIEAAVEDESSISDEVVSQSDSSDEEKAGSSKKRKKRKRRMVLFQEFKGMLHFRKQLEEKRSDDTARETATSKDDKNEAEKMEEVSSYDKQEGQSQVRVLPPLRISDTAEELNSKSSENGSISSKKNSGFDGKSEVNGENKSSVKNTKGKDAGFGGSIKIPDSKHLAGALQGGGESERRDLDADDESSSTEMDESKQKKKKSKKKQRKSKDKNDVREETDLVKGGNEPTGLEESTSSVSKVVEESLVVDGRTKRDRRRSKIIIEEDNQNGGSDDGQDRREGSQGGTEQGLVESEREKLKKSKRVKTSSREESGRNLSDGVEISVLENRAAEGGPTKHKSTDSAPTTEGRKKNLEDVAEMSNQKRLKAVKERQAELKQKQTAIKDALAAVDSREKSNGKNHMRFESTSEDLSDSEQEDQETRNKEQSKEKQMTLFDDSDDAEENSSSDDERFQIKPQFEGERGTKLLKLQDKFGDDQRFKLDERFAEDADDFDDEEVSEENAEDNGNKKKDGEAVDPETIDFEAEKARSLAVLENVLGKLLPRKKDGEDKKSQFRDMNYLHFDPTREDHSKFVLPKVEEDESKPTKAKRRKKNKKGDEDDPDNPLPEVSKELFSEVTTDLKSAFSQEGPASFSFFSNVDEDIDSKDKKQNDQDVEEAVPFTDHVFNQKKKLRWDSSDSEEETESKEEQESEKKQETTEEPPTKIPTVKSFFFTRDDDRMKGVTNQFCRGKDAAKVTKVWNNAREEILRAGTKRHQKALRDSQRNNRRNRLSNSKANPSGGKS